MNYSDIERQTFKTFLAFSALMLTFLLLFFNLSSSVYRVSDISYIDSEDLDYSSLERLIGISIWLVDDYYFQDFYNDNPTVESISITKELPNTLITNIVTSDKIAIIEDKRQVPSKTSVLYKNLYIERSKDTNNLAKVVIENGPVKEGFYEEIITFVLTLNKYSINLNNVDISFDGEGLYVFHLETTVSMGAPSDLARKASVVGYYIAENPCPGEIRLTYSEDGKEIKAITNCK
tara:strand:+ start:1640 stop:2341 length:702 start_codon:yes stop_codon:yes gene_type:complete